MVFTFIIDYCIQNVLDPVWCSKIPITFFIIFLNEELKIMFLILDFCIC